MKTINYGEKCDERVILLLGFFDCLHKGHLELIKKAKELRDVKHSKIALFTFKNDDFSQNGTLLCYNERIEKAERFGVDFIVAATFDESFKNTSYKDFFERLGATLNIDAIICGFDYKFGKNAEGNAENLQNLCEKTNIPVYVIPKTEAGGEKISTTRIKFLLENGKIHEANELLGEPYSITGKVVKGRQIGREIGFPTANINVPKHKFRIKCGVYKTHVLLGGVRYGAITNYGARPTFDLDFVLTETFIKDFSDDLYGKVITVFFDDYIRDIERFYDIEKLKVQLEKDKNV